MRLTKLGEICNVSSAGDKPTDFTEIKTAEHTIPVVANGIEDDGIIGYTSEPKISRNAVTISARGNIGTAFYRNYPYYPVIRLISVYPKNDSEIDCQYLYYLLKNSPLKSIGSSVQAQLTVPIASDVDLFIEEDYKNQQLIAAFLGTIDNKISTNNKIIETSEKLMREIYDYWFVQFDFPDDNGRPYKSSGGKMIYDENIKRKIPDGWRSTKLKELYKIERGISYSSKDIESSNGTPMINLACVDISRNYRDGGIKLYDGKFSSANVAKANDLIIACTDLTRNADIVGSPILVPDDGREYVFSMDMAKISSFSKELDNMYLYATLRTDYYHSFIKYWASGTNVLHLNLSGLDWYPVWLPPIKLQKTFAEIVRNINTNSGLLRKENASLASLRDWLLPMLMGGQIKIGD